MRAFGFLLSSFFSFFALFFPSFVVLEEEEVLEEVGAPEEEAPERAAPFTMWMVCEDWILYTVSASSSYEIKHQRLGG